MHMISRVVKRHEYYVPLVWSMVWGVLCVKPLHSDSDVVLGLLFLIFSVAGIAIYCNYVFGYADSVWIDGDTLVVVRRGKQSSFPIDHIKEVKQGIASPPTLILLVKPGDEQDIELVRFQPACSSSGLRYSEDIRKLLKRVRSN